MDIAIIGMAGRFPGANNIEELLYNLKNGVDSIRGISAQRIKDTTLPAGKVYRNCGYLEDVDKFDYRFFGISYAEAINMCPSQRLLLETAYETFEDAGYSPEYFNGSSTSVYTADSGNYYYYRHADKLTSTLITGNSQEFSPARISRYFNLAGNSMAINTACSSSITAIHLACNELRLGEADYSLVCSINLDLFPFDVFDSDIKLTSPDGRSKAFSAQSEGISFGETVCSVLLKPLDKALRDKDLIYAVIKGSSANNNGSLSASILAPSSERESLAIKKAWERAGVSPGDLGFIEAHGSGTQIGDSLEIEAFSRAARVSVNTAVQIPIGTIKSNIGHCMFAAGMVGLIKTVLSLKHEVIFPTIHCEELNPNIDFANSPVFVNTRLVEWKTAPGAGSRYASVNSLGRSGGNSHIVLSSQEVMTDPVEPLRSGNHLFTISSHTKQGLKGNIERLVQFLQNHSGVNLGDVSYTLNQGRKHYDHRLAVVASSVKELLDQLVVAMGTSGAQESPAKKTFLVFSDQSVTTIESLQFLAQRYPVFKQAMPVEADVQIPFVRSFVFQYGFFRLLQSWGIDGKHLISFGAGKIARDVILERITMAEALLRAQQYKVEPLTDLATKVSKFMQAEKEPVIALIDLGIESPITAAFRKSYAARIRTFSLKADDGENSLAAFLKELYSGMPQLHWTAVWADGAGKRISLPTYSFDRTRCWLRDEPQPSYSAIKKEEKQTTAERDKESSSGDASLVIGAIFSNVLKKEVVLPTNNFFKLGGDDATAVEAIAQINNRLKAAVTLGSLYCYPSPADLAGHLAQKPTVLQVVKAVWTVVFKEEQITDDADFFDIGGHSLMAAQIVQKMKKIFALKLNFDDVFQYPTPTEFTGYISASIPVEKEQPVTKAASDFPHAEKRQYYPVSHAQRRILMLEKLYKNAASYNMPREFVLDGYLDMLRLQSAFDQLIERHEILSTAFFFLDGKPYQRPIALKHLPIHVHDLSVNDWPEDEMEQEAHRLFLHHQKPFDLAAPPLLRVVVIKINAVRSLLLFDISHIAIDRQGYEVLAEDFLRLYLNLPLSPVDFQYRDYAVFQHKSVKYTGASESELFWLDMFREPLNSVSIPADFKRPEEPDNNGNMFSMALSPELSANIAALARKENVTLYVLLLTAFKTLIHRLAGAEDICIGMPFSERDNTSLYRMAGILLNTIVVRSLPGKDKPFSTYLHEIMNISTSAYKHGNYQFETLLEKIKYKREKNRNPVFDILFNSQTIAVATKEAREVATDNIRFTPRRAADNTSTFDITIMVDTMGSQTDFLVYYKTSLFRDSTIRYYFEQYALLLEQVAGDPNRALGDYSVFDKKATQRKQLTEIK